MKNLWFNRVMSAIVLLLWVAFFIFLFISVMEVPVQGQQAIGASSLPPTVPHHYRYSSNLDGSRQSWSERGTVQTVTPTYTFRPDGGVAYGHVVTSWNYSYSGSYQGQVYYLPRMVDGKSTAKPGTVSWPGRR